MTSDRLQQLRAQLQSLRQQHDAGTLDAAAYDAQRAALERELLDLVVAGTGPDDPGPATISATTTSATSAAATVPAFDAPDAPPVPVPARLWAVIAVVAVVVGAAGYVVTGAPRLASVGPEASRAAAQAAQAAEQAASGPLTMEQLATLTERLAERMKSQPDDPIGWAMLGRAYMLLQRPADAVEAYRKAVALKRDDAQLLVDYADAVAIRQDRNLAGEPTQLIEEALKLEPDNLKALSLSGTVAFERKDYATAVARWERVLAVGQLSPELVKQVQSSIDEARRLGKLPATSPGAGATANAAAASPPPASAPAAAGAAVRGTVKLAPALQAQVQPGDTVFVYARAVDGPRMPLAIVRHQVRELPLRFTLDDGQAMSPQTRLSAFPRVIVSARISKSGDAMPQPGDLIGQSGPIDTGAAGEIALEIRETVGR